MVTSYPDRTAPVVRGFWVLDNLLGMPPPPPPPDVPDLEPSGADGRVISVREAMEAHRKNPACAVCHVRMDPIGFSMENFDAIGRWRTSSHGIPVDASAVFADGTPLDGVKGLRPFLVIASRQLRSTHSSRKLLTYALGRHVDYRDQPAIRQIAREAAQATTVVIHHPWHRQKHAVPDEEIRDAVFLIWNGVLVTMPTDDRRPVVFGRSSLARDAHGSPADRGSRHGGRARRSGALRRTCRRNCRDA